MKQTVSTYIFAASLLFSSCADLDQSSISSIDKDNFYQSKGDIETAINGIYQEFSVDGFYGMYNNQSIYINDLQSDYVTADKLSSHTRVKQFCHTAYKSLCELCLGRALYSHQSRQCGYR